MLDDSGERSQRVFGDFAIILTAAQGLKPQKS